jgi:opacity protein-like surface antigen
MKTKMTLLASAAFAALAFAAPTQAAGSGWYVSVFGGANWNTDHSISAATAATPNADTLTWSADGDTGFVVGGAIGLNLNQVTPGLRAEVEVGYRQSNVDGLWSTFTFPLGTSSGTIDYDFSTFSVLANVWYDFDLGGVKPYVGGGIGWANAKADGSIAGGTTLAFDFEDDGFAWQLGAGINFDISPNMKLGVGYRYFEGPDVGVSLSSSTATGDLDNQNHAAIVNLTIGM